MFQHKAGGGGDKHVSANRGSGGVKEDDGEDGAMSDEKLQWNVSLLDGHAELHAGNSES